jgi:regulator of ribonuclease activity A
MTSMFRTADLCDEFGVLCTCCALQFHDFGRCSAFFGRIRTVKCVDDNALVRRVLGTQSDGEIMVVDGGGFLRSALVGDQLAELAIRNGWGGIVVFGAVRDSAVLRGMEIGVKALGTNPRRAGRSGVGQSDVPVTFGNVVFRPGDWIYSDPDGILVAAQDLLKSKNVQSGESLIRQA